MSRFTNQPGCIQRCWMAVLSLVFAAGSLAAAPVVPDGSAAGPGRRRLRRRRTGSTPTTPPRALAKTMRQDRYPGRAYRRNGRWYEGMKRGQPDVIKRVPTPAGGLPGSTGRVAPAVAAERAFRAAQPIVDVGDEVILLHAEAGAARNARLQRLQGATARASRQPARGRRNAFDHVRLAPLHALVPAAVLRYARRIPVLLIVFASALGGVVGVLPVCVFEVVADLGSSC